MTPHTDISSIVFSVHALESKQFDLCVIFVKCFSGKDKMFEWKCIVVIGNSKKKKYKILKGIADVSKLKANYQIYSVLIDMNSCAILL